MELYSLKFTTCQLGVKIAAIDSPMAINVNTTQNVIVAFWGISDIFAAKKFKFLLNLKLETN